jgi:predicted nuclease with TOPRIM domain
MNQIYTTIDALKKAVESSRPNVKFKKIMSYISTLETQLKELNSQPEEENTEIIEDTTPEEITEEQIDEAINEDLVEAEDNEIDLLKYENYTLSELRTEFPDIKATSKEAFLEKLYSL